MSMKLIFLGDEYVGKTSIINAITNKAFETSYTPTVAIENNLKIMQVQNKFIKFNLLDVPPPENNNLLPFNESLKNFHAAIIVFDITQIPSFNNIDRYYETIKKYSGKNNFPLIIIGNKFDLQSKRKVATSVGQSKAQELNGFFFEISAKDSQTVIETWAEIINLLTNKKERNGKIENRAFFSNGFGQPTEDHKKLIRPTTADIYSQNINRSQNSIKEKKKADFSIRAAGNKPKKDNFNLNISQDNNYSLGIIQDKPKLLKINSKKKNNYFPSTSNLKGEPLQAETLFEELIIYKNFCNDLKDENLRLRTTNIKIEQEIKNYEKVVSDLKAFETTRAQFLRGPTDCLNVNLKSQIKDLKEELRYCREEMEKMKRNIKQTKFQELEIEKKAFSEENIRLKNLLKEVQSKNIEHFKKDQEMANLEKQFYIQDIEIKSLRKENKDFFDKIKSYEVNLQELKLVHENEIKLMRSIANSAKKNNLQNTEVREQKANFAKSNPASQEMKPELKDNQLEGLKKQIKQQEEEINNLKERMKEKTLNFEFLNETPIPKQKSQKKVINESEKLPIEIIDEIKLTFILKNINPDDLETSLFKQLIETLSFKKNDVKAILSKFPLNFDESTSTMISNHIRPDSNSCSLKDISNYLREILIDFDVKKSKESFIVQEFRPEILNIIYDRKGLISEKIASFDKLTFANLKTVFSEIDLEIEKSLLQKLLLEFSSFKEYQINASFNEFFEDYYMKKQNLNSPSRLSQAFSPALKSKEVSEIYENSTQKKTNPLNDMEYSISEQKEISYNEFSSP